MYELEKNPFHNSLDITDVPMQLANCTDPSYAFKFTDYHTYYDFVLDVKHKK